MLYYSLVYLLVAVIAAVLGYSDLVAPAASGIARTLFVLFSVIAVVSYCVYLASRR